MMLSQIAGKRLTYKEVTGKVGETAFLVLCAGSAGQSLNVASHRVRFCFFVRLLIAPRFAVVERIRRGATYR